MSDLDKTASVTEIHQGYETASEQTRHKLGIIAVEETAVLVAAVAEVFRHRPLGVIGALAVGEGLIGYQAWRWKKAAREAAKDEEYSTNRPPFRTGW